MAASVVQHANISDGSAVIIPGNDTVAINSLDPLSTVNAGGVSVLQTYPGGAATVGAIDYAYQLYATGAIDTTFAKSNGMGGITLDLQPLPIEIGNRVWLDSNGDGIQDANEPGLSGVTVDLYDSTGTTLLATAVTDANGNYYFSSAAGSSTSSAIYNLALAPNTSYVIKLNNAANYAAAGPLAGLFLSPTAAGSDRSLDSNGALVGGFATANVTTGSSGQNDHSFDFGFATSITIGDFVWRDQNGNGIQNVGEPGIPGVTVDLYNSSGTLLSTAITDNSGHYSFSNNTGTSTASAIDNITGLTPSTPGYTIRLDNAVNYAPGGPLSGLTVSPAFQGADTTIDSNGQLFSPTDDRATVNAPAAGTSDLSIDFGFTPLLAIGNRVFVDANNDGILDNGEVGLNGVTVQLFASNISGNPVGGAEATTATAGGGYYLFSGLLPGNYVVEITPPSGYVSSTGTNGSATGAFEPAPNPNVNTTDSQDKGTTAGALITSGLITLVGGSEPTGESDIGPGGAGAADSDSNLTVDFGVFPTLSVGNYIWADTNNDGIVDNGESGIPGVSVSLLNSANAVVATTTTNSSGYYLFSDLIPGTYTVRVNASNFTAANALVGYVSSTGVLGSAIGTYEPSTLGTGSNNQDHGTTSGTLGGAGFVIGNPIVLAVGSEPTGEEESSATTGITDPAVDANSDATQDFGFFKPLTIGDKVFFDSNNDGILDNGELGLRGITVSLLNSSGTVIVTTTTDSSGLYQFTDLIPGTYTVQLSNLPAGYVSSTGTNGSATGAYEPGSTIYTDATNNTDHGTEAVGGTIISQPVILTVPGTNPDSAGLANMNVDFGVFPTLSVGNFIWADANNDGIVDNGEIGIPGVSISLLNSANAVVATTTTNSSGYYLFSDLIPGTYSVRVNASNFAPASALSGYQSSSGTSGSATGPFEPSTLATGSNNQDHGTTSGTLGSGGFIIGNPIIVAVGSEPTGEEESAATTGITDPAADANSDATQDFGFVRIGNISGTVYFDSNANGVYDLGTDVPLQGVTVTLTGIVGGLPIAPLTTTTNSAGNYSFGNLPAGSYTITESQPVAYNEGTDTLGDVNGTATGSATLQDVFSGVTLPGGGVGAGYNFGELGAGISGTVFIDGNRDGIDNNGDVGKSGVTITLTNGGGTVIGTTTTGPNGTFSIGNVPPGAYTITETVPGGFGTSTTITRSITVPVAGLGGIDFGLTLSSLSGSVYLDDNNNGTPDAGEPAIPGVTVTLTDASGNPVTDGYGNPIAPVLTDANGAFQFTGLLAGTYHLVETQPSGYGQGIDSPGTFGDITAPTQTATSDTVALAVPLGQDGPGYLFGELPGGLSGTVFLDSNRDTTLDNGETGIPGLPITVTLTNSTTGIATTVQTNPDGTYSFPLVPPGTYTVSISDPSGYVSTTSTTLTVTQPITGTTGINFGLFQPLSIGDTIWADTNNDGKLDNGEAGIGGVTVQLLDPSGNVVATTVSNAQGGYLFTNLSSGTYRVTIAASNFASGGVLNGYSSSTGSRLSGSLTSGPQEPAANDNIDGEDKGTATGGAGSSVQGGLITLSPGTQPTGEATIPGGIVDRAIDANSNRTQDFGFVLLKVDIATKIVADNPAPLLGQDDGLTITVTNNGPGVATGMIAGVQIPPGTTFVGVSGIGQGTYDPATGLWNIGTVPVGASVVLHLNVQVNAPGPLQATAVVSAAEPETDPLNNTSVTVITTPQTTDPISKRNFLASTATTGATSAIAATTLTAAIPGSMAIIATGAGPGAVPLVEVFDRATGQLRLSFLAYDSSFAGGVNVALGDVNGDGVPDIITAPMSGGGPDVKVFDGQTGQLIDSFYAFDPSFSGGVHLAAADVDNTGTVDIIVGAGNGGSPRIVVFRPDGTVVSSFFAYDSSFRNGVNVAAANIGGVPQIVAGAAAGGGPNVKLFNPITGAVTSSFFAFDSTFRGGVSVAIGNEGGIAEIFAGAGPGGGPQVKVFSETGQQLASYEPMDSSFRGGTNVAAADITGSGSDDLIVAPGAGDGSEVFGLDPKTGLVVDQFQAFASGFNGGVNLAAANTK